MDELIRKLANDYIQEYIRLNRKNPTSDMVSNVIGMVKRDIQDAMSKGMTYEQMYAKAFNENVDKNVLNDNARMAGQAYELMSTPELRSNAAGNRSGAGRGLAPYYNLNDIGTNPSGPEAGRGMVNPRGVNNQNLIMNERVVRPTYDAEMRMKNYR